AELKLSAPGGCVPVDQVALDFDIVCFIPCCRTSKTAHTLCKFEEEMIMRENAVTIIQLEDNNQETSITVFASRGQYAQAGFRLKHEKKLNGRRTSTSCRWLDADTQARAAPLSTAAKYIRQHQTLETSESLVTLQHTTGLRCIPVLLLGDKPSDFFELCFDSDKNDFEHIAVGILTVINEDSPHSSSLIHADPVSTS
ncbi:hypothetical protein IRJ41_018612, partial [Triplophysa rosa]